MLDCHIHLLNTLLEGSDDIITILNSDGSRKHMIGPWEAITGYSVEESLNTSGFGYVHPNDQLRLKKVFQKLLSGECKTIKNQWRAKHKNGSWIWVEGTATYCLHIKEINGIVIVVRDITQQKKTEQDLKLFKKTVANSTDAIGISTPDGVHWYQNHAFDELFGKIGEDPPKTLYADESVGREVFATIMSGNEWVGEVEMNGKSGKLLHIFLRAYAMKDSEGTVKGLVGLHSDLTETKKMQLQLNHKQKMEAIGQLAGGIAHDFNNLLSAILGTSDLIARNAGNVEKSIKYTKMIKNAATRSSELIEKLLLFGRKLEIKFTSVDVHAVLSETISLLKRSIDKKISIISDLKAENAFIDGDFSQLVTVFLNLAVNAEHAMPGGGTLQFFTETVILDEDFCNTSQFNLSPGSYILIKVVDSGMGIPEDELLRIFEPFYTTKSSQKGTGLGLSTTYGTIIQHLGAISVTSEVGKGSTFNIYLPLIKPEPKTVHQTEEINHGTGNILIIDDEQAILSTVSDQLEYLGYSTLTSNNGEAGLKLYIEKQDKIDLIIVDMIMPVMSGKELFLKIRDINPKQKVIASSGYFHDEDLIEMKSHGLSGFLKKPYTTIELSNKISDVLQKQ